MPTPKTTDHPAIQYRIRQFLVKNPECRKGHMLTQETVGYDAERDKLTCLYCTGVLHYPRRSKDRVLGAQEKDHRQTVLSVRRYLLDLYEKTGNPVSANNVHDYCDTHRITIGPWVGSVFRRGWKWYGMTESSRPGHHRCSLKTWVPL